MNFKSKQKNRKSFFLTKLYQILDNPDTQHIMKWHEDGFIIQNVSKLESLILKDNFKHSNYASFVRQLNIYGFKQKERQTNFIFYIHDNISQSKQELLQLKYQNKIEKPNFSEYQTLEQMQSELENTLSQMKVKQEQLKEQIRIHLLLMGLLTTHIINLIKKTETFIQQYQQNSEFVFNNANKLFTNARDFLILRQYNILKLIHPELFNSETSSFATTPIPFYNDQLYQLSKLFLF